MQNLHNILALFSGAAHTYLTQKLDSRTNSLTITETEWKQSKPEQAYNCDTEWSVSEKWKARVCLEQT